MRTENQKNSISKTVKKEYGIGEISIFRLFRILPLIGILLVSFASPTLADIANMEFEIDYFDLETGTVTTSWDMLEYPAGSDFKFAYNGGYIPHAVIFQNQYDGVQIAYTTEDYADVGYSDTAGLTFTTSLIDIPFDQVAVLQTAEENYYKVGPLGEVDFRETFQYAQLTPVVAEDDDYSTDEDTTLAIPAPGVLANDESLEGDTLIVTGNTDPASGSVIVNADGSLTYEPDENFCGTDTFEYTISDGIDSDTATVTIEVNCVNDVPVAEDDDYTTDEDTTLTVSAPGVLENDADIEGDPLCVLNPESITIDPAYGIVEVNEDGSLTYEPSPNYCGSVTFEYTTSDGIDYDTATVTIEVNCVNDAPAAVDDDDSTDENTMVEVDVLANDEDPDEDDALTIISVTDPLHGTASTNGEIVTYQPELWYSGDDSFDYTITDIAGSTATATVTITVNDVIPSTEDIFASIEALPDEAFDKDADNQKNAFGNKLGEISNLIANKQYSDAINKLENDIRSKVDGDESPKDWIVIDSGAQSELCEMIDTLVNALKALLSV